MHMPQMDGLALARHIKADPHLANTALVMLTSVGAYGDIQAAHQAGVSIHINKPARQNELRNALRTAKNRLSPALTLPKPTSSVLGAVTTERASTVPPPFAHARLLLAEDNPVNQEVALTMLKLLGCQVNIANNGQEALKALARATYDLVLMDCQMPEMDGFEATKAIRARESQLLVRKETIQKSALTAGHWPLATGHVPIIALTANARSGDRERCLAAGMDDYLSKPFSYEKLHEILCRWLPQATQVSRSQKGNPLSTIGPAAPGPLSPVAAQPLGTSLPPPEKGDAGGLLDAAALNQIRALQRPGGPNFLHKVISNYLKDAVQLIETIRKAIAQNDPPTLHRAAHSLKSTSATIGAQSLAGLCKDLEAIGRAHTTDNAAALLPAIENEYQQVATALRAQL
jgi:CheY-like chemotaxis protein